MKEGIYIRIGHVERMGGTWSSFACFVLILKLVGKRWVESCINKPKPGEKAKRSTTGKTHLEIPQPHGFSFSCSGSVKIRSYPHRTRNFDSSIFSLVLGVRARGRHLFFHLPFLESSNDGEFEICLVWLGGILAF